MAKILITGGAGFIGSHLTEELVNRGYQVLVYDNLRTGRQDNLHCPHDFILGDIRDYQSLAAAMEKSQYVFHLAALTNVTESMKQMDECFAINVQGTLNVLKAARDQGVKKVVFASSAAVYGDTPELPKTETMRLEPRSPYAISKANAEFCCDLFWRSYQLPTVCARFFNVFGERQDSNSAYAAVIPIFIHNTLHNLPIRIFGDGAQTRDFIYVKDIVKALLFLMNDGTGIFNVGYGETIDINSLARMIQECLGWSNPLQYLPPRPGEIKHSYASVQKLTEAGFKPDYTLRDGIARTIAYLRIQESVVRIQKSVVDSQ